MIYTTHFNGIDGDSQESGRQLLGVTYLDKASNKSNYAREFVHVDVEVRQFVAHSLVKYNLAPLSYSTETAEISGGIQLGVGGSGQVNLGKLGWRHWR